MDDYPTCSHDVFIFDQTSASIIQKRKKELTGVCEFLESNFLQQVQRHFDTVLVESADMAYSRNKLGRPTKCMSQKESVQQTIDKMQEHLTKMQSKRCICFSFCRVLVRVWVRGVSEIHDVQMMTYYKLFNMS